MKKIILITIVVLIVVVSASLLIKEKKQTVEKLVTTEMFDTELEESLIEIDSVITETEETLERIEERPEERLESPSYSDIYRINLAEIIRMIEQTKGAKIENLEVIDNELIITFLDPSRYMENEPSEVAFFMLFALANRLSTVGEREGNIDTISLVSKFKSGKLVRVSAIIDDVVALYTGNLDGEEFLKKIVIRKL